MMVSLWARKLGIVIAAVALCAAAAGHASEAPAATPKKSAHQMRYYGGPKSPMWRG
jgi:Spy/CpxP family protein refolding chaperone